MGGLNEQTIKSRVEMEPIFYILMNNEFPSGCNEKKRSLRRQRATFQIKGVFFAFLLPVLCEFVRRLMSHVHKHFCYIVLHRKAGSMMST